MIVATVTSAKMTAVTMRISPKTENASCAQASSAGTEVCLVVKLVAVEGLGARGSHSSAQDSCW